MLQGILKTSLAALLGAMALLALEAAAMMLLTGRPLNDSASPLVEFLPLLQVLWEQNPLQALSMSLEQGLLVLANRDAELDARTWSLTIYPGSALCLLLAGLLLDRGRRARAALGLRQLLALTIALFMVVLPGLYLVVAAHCASPTWMPVVVLRELQSPTGFGWRFLGDLPVAPEAFIDATRLASLLTGLLLGTLLTRRGGV